MARTMWGWGPDIAPLAEQELGGTHLIPEDKRSHHLPSCGGKSPSHLKAAEITSAWDYDGLNRVAGELITEHGVVRWIPTHGSLLQQITSAGALHLTLS